MFPRKESENGAGMTFLVSVVEVVHAGIIEIDRLLHEPQAGLSP
jgi:hypothetical protein